MNLHRQKKFTTAARRLGAVLALFVFLTARSAETTGGGRWLLIFDSSATMKKYLPATQAAVTHFFSTSADGQLEAGDSVGVWTFDRQLNAQFATFAWLPEKTTAATSNLVAFLHQQRYQTDSRLALLQGPLSQVAAGSRRLTVVLFSDGQSEISGTPYDQGINQTFSDSKAERRKSQQPFIVVLRTQFGKFTGCTMNFPPGTINFPPFPAPPPPLPPAAPPPPAVVVAPPVAVPSLVIFGTHVGTNSNAPGIAPEPPTNARISAPITAVIASTNHAAAAAATTNPAAAVTNPIVAVTAQVIAVTNPVIAATNAPATNHVAVMPPVITPPMKTAAAAAPATNLVAATAPGAPDQPVGMLIYAGAALLVTAGALAVFFLARTGHRPHASLITSSMQDDPRLPPRK